MDTVDSKKRAIAYSVLAHISNNGNLAKGSFDIFVPLVKKSLQHLNEKGLYKNDSINIIAEQILNDFVIDIPLPVLRNILKVIAKEVNTEKSKFILFNDDSFSIEKYVFEDFDEELQKTEDEINAINQLYKNFCDSKKLDNPTNIFDFLDKNRIEVSHYLANKDKAKQHDDSIAAQFVSFFQSQKEIYEIFRSLYLGSFLVSLLEYTPKEIKTNVTLLLDTNFIISLVDLNTPESTKTCTTLYEICKKLGFIFELLEDTIDEIQWLLNNKSKELSRAVLSKTINKEDILNACERRNLSSVDLDRISDNVRNTIENDFQIHIIPHTDNLKNKARYDNSYEILRKYRNSDKSALHDAMAVVYVKEKRNNKQIKDFEKVNCWFLNNSITHNSEQDVQPDSIYQSNNGFQPISIKADDLLNILWLSNPSLQISNTDFVDIGINSLVAFSLNASLPKTSVIKELDDNIQKYVGDNSITDKDVYYLSTRIANKRLSDISSLNESAKNNPTEFVKQIKDIAEEQKKFEEKRAENLENAVKLFMEMKDTYDKKTTELKEKEEKFGSEVTQIAEENKNLKEENKEFLARELKAFDNFNKEQIKRQEEYKNMKVGKWRSNAFIFFILGLIVLGLMIALSYFEIIPQNLSIIIPILTGIVNIFPIKHVYHVYFNPVYEKNYKDQIIIPKELETITLEEYRKRNQ